ncbi:MAG: hypothetical protein GH158_00410 [Dehalococcoidia bacterium]|nr:hypothetical protein [Dehalococcoidia bacterium]
MKWKKFGNTIFIVFVIVFFAWVFLETLVDAMPLNWFGEFILFLIGLVFLLIFGLILWFMGFSLFEFIRNVWYLLTKTKKQREQIKEQREKEREEEKARQEFIDNLKRRGLMH